MNMADSTTNEGIVIYLDRSRTSQAFPKGECLWQEEIDKINSLLKNQLELIPQANGGDDAPDRLPFLAIAIFGTNGSGKSSLLRTLVHQTNARKEGSLHGKIYSLPVIKPNILAKDDHFLYHFLATALEADRKENKTESNNPSQETTRLLTPVQQVFQEVSEYLQVVDDSEKLQEFDPLNVSLERLERHTSDLYLKEKLQLFLDKLADSLTSSRSSLVLLPVDDSDMSQESLVASLDTYHRYLMHPRLVPVFTFMGRLAENLMYKQFGKALKEKATRNTPAHEGKLRELDIYEQITLQYLAKLFPVRNRIRLGPAPARVQQATLFLPNSNANGKKGEEPTPVIKILEASSRLLYGYTEQPVEQKVRIALRPAVLRRQLQVLDAMIDAGVLDLADRKSILQSKTWATIFDKAAWFLLNAHRDVLKEMDIYFDELHGWTPMGLRQEFLTRILNLDLNSRREFFRKWFYRTEDRRGQVISLLAATIFRPRLVQEPPTGDNLQDETRTRGEDVTWSEESSRKSFLWFLNLWMGFYLPVVLSRNRHNLETEKNGNHYIRGAGWNLFSGPQRAMREAVRMGEIASTGMMRVEAEKFAEYINPRGNYLREDEEKARTVSLLLHIWGCYGYEDGQPWAAVSLWRGLGLMGQILEVVLDLDEKERKQRVRALLRNHVKTAAVSSYVSRKNHQNLGRIMFENLEYKADEDESTDNGNLKVMKAKTGDEEKDPIRDLEHEARYDPLSKFVCATNREESENEGEEKCDLSEVLTKRILEWLDSWLEYWKGLQDKKAAENWEGCPMRRLHGDSILNIFWQNLERAYIRVSLFKDHEEETARTILAKWLKVLLDYCVPDSPVQKLILSCPFTWPLIYTQKWKFFLKKSILTEFRALTIYEEKDPDKPAVDPKDSADESQQPKPSPKDKKK